jgi:hypothetical protein
MVREARVLGWQSIGVLVLFAISLSAGCKTMNMTIESDPPGAFVVVNRTPVGRTPLVVPQVPAQDDLVMTFLKEGLPPKTVVVLADEYSWGAGYSLPSDKISVKLGDGRRAELYGSAEPLLPPTP